MLMLVSLQNGGLSQIIFYLIFSSFIWVIIYGVTYLDECAGPTTITSTIRAFLSYTYKLSSIFAVFQPQFKHVQSSDETENTMIVSG